MPARQMVVRSSVGRLSALRRLGPTLHDARVRAVAVGSVGVGVVDVRSALTPAGGMTVFAGTAFALLGRGMVHGRHGAHRALVALLAGGSLGWILSRSHPREAVAGAVMVALLLLAPPVFILDAKPERRRLVASWIVAVVLMDVAIGCGALVLLRRVAPGVALHETLARLVGLSGPLAAHGRQGSVPGSVTLLGVISLAGLLVFALAPTADESEPQDAERQRARWLVREHADDSIDGFALRRDKRFVLSRDGAAVIAYRYLFGVGLASGDPVGQASAFDDCLREFLVRCHEHGWRPVVMMAGADCLGLYDRLGMKVLYLGDEVVIDVNTFSLGGGRMRNVRQAVSRSANAGVTTDVVREGDLSPELRRSLADVAARSRGRHRELGFSMALEEPFSAEHPECLLVVCWNRMGEPIAFQRYVPCKGGECVSLDAMRRIPGSPNGVNERMIVEMVRWAGAHGVTELSVNFVGFRRVIAEGASPSAARFVAGRFLRIVNPFKVASLYRFSAKFHPRWVPRYLAYRSRADLPAIGVAAMTAEGLLPLSRPAAASNQ